MMTKLIRPCTLWGKTFDALCVNDIIRDDKLENRKKFDFNVALYFLGNHFIIYSPYVQTRKEQDALFQEAITAIYNALNAPVQATNEVLDAMNKVPEANFLMRDDYDNLVECRYDSKWRMREVNGVYLPVGAWLYTKVQEYSPSFSSERLAVDDLIQADCPLALQVLLQFYTDGTSIKGKETE